MGWFDYFQVLCLSFFLLVFVGRTLYLRLHKGIQVLTLGMGKQGLQQVVEVLFFIGLAVWVAEVLLYALPTDTRLFGGFLSVRLIHSVVAKALGALLIVLSFALFVWALISFGHSWRVGIDRDRPGELVRSGAFAISRNPIFVFLDLYFVGTFLINGTVVFLLFAILVVVGLHYQILQEEKFLEEKYHLAYREYRATTRRYVGRRGSTRRKRRNPVMRQAWEEHGWQVGEQEVLDDYPSP